MAVAQPTIMTAVPRFYQNLFSKISLNFLKQKGLKKKLIESTIYLGTKNLNGKELNLREKIVNFLCERLVRKKIKNQFGGKLKAFVSGGGALDQKIGEFLNSIGLPTLQGYGLTETSPVVSCNIPGKIKIETVGPPFKTNQVKIADDGEILAKGPNIMLGYYNNEAATNDVFDDEGWFHTGDIGKIDDDGFLKITDRKKSLIVTSAGKNIAPAPLEVAMNQSKFIQQSLIIGDQRNFISALIVPSFDNVNDYLLTLNKEKLSNEAMVDHHDVLTLFDNEIQKIMSKFSQFESVKKYKLLPCEFSIEKGEMTPKMSIVRKKVIANYENLIESIYK
jgi:long-chain acyl-CoA synthetase